MDVDNEHKQPQTEQAPAPEDAPFAADVTSTDGEVTQASDVKLKGAHVVPLYLDGFSLSIPFRQVKVIEMLDKPDEAGHNAKVSLVGDRKLQGVIAFPEGEGVAGTMAPGEFSLLGSKLRSIVFK